MMFNLLLQFFYKPFILIIRQRVLLRRMARREFESRFRGSVLGFAWALINPLFMMVVYTFVFHAVLAARWPGPATNSRSGYALNLLSGLILFNLLAECLNRAPHLILENPSYVKKLVFPVEIMPVVALIGSITSAGIGGLVLLTFQCFLTGPPPPTIFLLPVLILPLLLLALGASYLLAALGVFLRDIGQLTAPLVMTLMFLTPVFYPAEIVPLPWRDWLFLNPLAATIGWARNALFLGTLPGLSAYLGQLVAGLLLLAVSYRIFMTLRPGFADVV